MNIINRCQHDTKQMIYAKTNILLQDWDIRTSGIFSEDNFLIVHGHKEGCRAWDLKCVQHWDEWQKPPILNFGPVASM